MALDAFHQQLFRHVANEISEFADPRWFDTAPAVDNVKHDFQYEDHDFTFVKMGYTTLGNFKGLGYILRNVREGTNWTFWVKNPSSVTVNKRALLHAIDLALNDPNAAKVLWNVDANDFATA